MHWSNMVEILREAASFRGILNILDELNLILLSRMSQQENLEMLSHELGHAAKKIADQHEQLVKLED